MDARPVKGRAANVAMRRRGCFIFIVVSVFGFPLFPAEKRISSGYAFDDLLACIHFRLIVGKMNDTFLIRDAECGVRNDGRKAEYGRKNAESGLGGQFQI